MEAAADHPLRIIRAITGPHRAARECGTRRVEEQAIRIEARPGTARAIDPPPVAELGRQTGDSDVPVITRPVLRGMERELGERLPQAIAGKNHQVDARPMATEKCEVVTVGARCDPKW